MKAAPHHTIITVTAPSGRKVAVELTAREVKVVRKGYMPWPLMIALDSELGALERKHGTYVRTALKMTGPDSVALEVAA